MSPAEPEPRLALLVARDGGRAHDDAVIVLGLLDLVAGGAWRMEKGGLRRRWRLRRVTAPRHGGRALTVLDDGLTGAPQEGGVVPVQALGWWMRHYGIGATRVRRAALEDPPASGEPPPAPDRRASDLDVALGGFAVTDAERDFAAKLLKARDRPTGLVGDAYNGDNVSAAVRYGPGV